MINLLMKYVFSHGIKAWLLMIMAMSVGLLTWNFIAKVNSVDDLKTTIALRDQTIAQERIQRDDVLKDWEQYNNAQQQFLDNIIEENEENEERVAKLQNTFRKHNLETLSVAKPGLIEARLNRGSDAINRMYECITGNTDSCPPDPTS
jgi:hypothetical protein